MVGGPVVVGRSNVEVTSGLDTQNWEVFMNRAARALALAIGVSAILTGGALGKAGGIPAIPLNNEQETTGATGGGSGFFSYTIDGTELCYTLEVRSLTAAPVAAHIHIGSRHVPGPVRIPLVPPSSATGSVSTCTTASADDLAAIAADPSAWYVNVHTPSFPGGEIRGQLK